MVGTHDALSSSSEEFLSDFGDLKQTHQVQKLHDVLKPHLVCDYYNFGVNVPTESLTLLTLKLRRMKEHVEKSIAPKEETIVEVELTVTQKKYYKAIYEKVLTSCFLILSHELWTNESAQNTAFLTKGCSGGNVPNMLNIMMQLRKCCNVCIWPLRAFCHIPQCLTFTQQN